jgi:hypothetical protein
MHSLTHVLLAFGLAVAVHATSRHLWPSWNTVLGFCAIGLPIGLGLAAAVGLSDPFSLPEFIGVVALFAFLCELYLFALTFVIGSVSVSLLLAVNAQPSAKPKPAEQLHSATQMTALRIARLTELRFLQLQDGQLALTKRGEIVLRVFIALRDFFGHKNHFFR